jgi:hypothetical protein
MADDRRMTAQEVADELNSIGGWRKDTPRKSKGYMAICPNHDDRNPSLSVRETEGGRILLNCFATTCTDKEAVVHAVERALRLDPGALGGPGKAYQGGSKHDSVKTIRKEFDAIVPTPPDAPAFSATSRRFRSKNHGQPTRTWTYRNERGQVMGHVARYEARNADGGIDKMIWPWTFALRDGKREWVVGAMPEPRVPYNLDRIANDPRSIIQWHEGEKSADAGAIIFPDWIPTTTVGGGSAPHMTDFSAFAGRTVVLCMDMDAAGVDYINFVATRLREVGAHVRVLRFPTNASVVDGRLVHRPYVTQPGDDMADHVDNGWTTELLRQAVEESGLPLTWSIDDWKEE